MRLGDADRESAAIPGSPASPSTTARSRPARSSAPSAAPSSTARTSSPHAVSAGAVAVVARPEARSRARPISPPPEPRREFARLAARFFEPFPETVVAVTGTNGKTSSVELTRQLWRMAGHHAASIGTLGRHHRRRPGHDRPDHARHRHLPLQHGRAGARGGHPCRLRGVEPRPAQYRTEGLPVHAAAFTNFSRDHLDYHEHDGGLFRGQDAAVRRSRRAGRRGRGLDRRSQVGRGDRGACRGARAAAADGRRARRDAEAGRPRADPARPDA